ncbi:MAG: 2OG-Fe(II) oxygenase [Cyanobacteria bacterium HKST-UBA03]|nr:2OG-Fe(II) oxygenase [Cyanobacteria bacterium HKST-UBA03]
MQDTQTQSQQAQTELQIQSNGYPGPDQEEMIYKQARGFMYSRPKVCVLPNFLSHQECDHMMELANRMLCPSTVIDPTTGHNVPNKDRSSHNACFYRGQDEVISQIEQRIANVTMLPVEYGEGLQVLRYEVGQEYKPHFDYFDPTLSGSKQPLDEGGQRVATMLMYLSAPEEGGETTFPDIGLSVAPVKGNAILFWSVLPNLQVDPLSKHGSAPVKSGVKWTMTKWIRQGPWEPKARY